VTLEPEPDFGAARSDGTPGKRLSAEHDNRSHNWASGTSLNPLIRAARRAFDLRAADQFRSVKEFQKRVDAFKDTFDDPAQLTLRRLLRQWIQRHKTFSLVLLLLLVLAGTIGGLYFSGKLDKYLAKAAEVLPRSRSVQPALRQPSP
jgi:hypothetical protein